MKKMAIFLAGLLIGAAVLWIVMQEPRSRPSPTANGIVRAPIQPSPDEGIGAVPEANAAPPLPAGAPDPSATDPHDDGARPGSAAGHSTSSTPVESPRSAPAPRSGEPQLLLPVSGVKVADLADTFSDARSHGRRHDAIDIMAPAGTPVVAVADGTIIKLFNSKPGGHTIYQFDAAGELAYYYAHLDRYAQGLSEGMKVARGDVIGFVGHSGNASPHAPHLHFAIFVLGPEKNWWQGTALNPYPLLGGR